MNKIENYCRSILKSVADFSRSKGAEFDFGSLGRKIFNQLEGSDTKISSWEAKVDESLKPTFQAKEDAMKTLIKKCSSSATKMISYGRFERFLVFAEIQGCSQYKLSRCKEEDVIVHTQKLLGLMNQYPTQTTEAGVSDEEKQGLNDSLNTANSLINEPQQLRREHHDINVMINDEVMKSYNIIINSLKGYMQSQFEVSNPALYEEFTRLFTIVRPVSQTRSVVGTIKDTNGNALRLVRVSVDGNAPKIKGGKTGSFFIQNLTPGAHEIAFSRKSYKKHVTKVMIHPLKTVELNIQLLAEDV
ncbi:carboxypeptidase regulatory-like domain-containing protein [Prolixibacteraceae bacterium JC049]|nr:carboxypeptidase regulatory-like domain-containing protein [Prolixibacteraceae bacterium JC049]